MPHLSSERLRVAAAALLLPAGAACSDLVSSPDPLEPPASALEAVSCRAEVAARSVSCHAPTGDARYSRIIGGQNVYVRVSSSNVSYDSVSRVFGFDVTVQNLMVQRMGTDGIDSSGIRVFFTDEPSITSGAGAVTVRNPAGVGIFTGSGQPYFHYPETLGYLAVSAAQRWELDVASTVGTFTFTLYISTPLLPVIVFDKSDGGNRDIYRVGLDGSDLVRLTTNAGDDRDPTVAGGTVVFTTYRHGNAELYAIPLVGGAESRLTATAESETDPALSPDGRRVAFARPAAGHGRIYTAPLDSLAAATSLTPAGGAAIEATPHWSSNTSLAFMSTRNSSADLWQASPGSPATLLFGVADSAEVEPAWSADGRRVAFASNSSGDTEIYMYEPGTSARTRLTTRAGTDGSPTWLRDGRIVFVCYTGASPALCVLDPAVPGSYRVIPTGSGAPFRPWAVQF